MRRSFYRLTLLILVAVGFTAFPTHAFAKANPPQAALGPQAHPADYPGLQQQKLMASDATTNDEFGYSVALSGDGNTALIGLYKRANYTGAAIVFVRSGNVWTQQQILTTAGLVAGDRFGTSVALSYDGNYALIGAEQVSSSTGAAYVFTRSGSTWTQQQQLNASDATTGNYFGWAAALSSDGATAIIGRNGNGGAAYVFTRSGTTWTQQQKLAGADQTASDNFGNSVAIASDGNTALVGAEAKASNTGAAYVFTRSGGTWTQQQKLTASDAATGDYFGKSAALSGDGVTALLGAEAKTSGTGAAYVFTLSAGTWTQQQKLTASDAATGDYFGTSSALSNDGNTALIGAYRKATFAGAAYTYTRSGGTWTQAQKMLGSDTAIFDQFGNAVALSSDGNTGLIGAKGQNSSTGAAYVFIPPPATATPTRTATATPSNTATATLTPTNTRTPSNTSTATLTPSNTATATLTPSNTPTLTLTPSNTATATVTPSNTATSTLTPSNTSTPTLTPSNTATFTPTFTNTPVPLRPDTIGVYNAGVFYLRNTNNSGVANITAFFGGDPSDLPIAGDWNGDGVDTIGVYRNSTAFFFLSDSNTVPTVSYTVLFGNPGDIAFAGKWSADMTHDGIGVYRNSNGILYQKKDLTNGFSDFFAVFGDPGDQPIAGDWNANGFDSIGIYRSSTAHWFLTNNSTPAGIVFSDIDFDWTIGGNAPVVGDWDGDGGSTVGYFTNLGVFALHSTNASAGADTVFPFGPTNGRPIAGKWIPASKPPVGSVVGNGQPGNGTNVSGDGHAD